MYIYIVIYIYMFHSLVFLRQFKSIVFGKNTTEKKDFELQMKILREVGLDD